MGLQEWGRGNSGQVCPIGEELMKGLNNVSSLVNTAPLWTVTPDEPAPRTSDQVFVLHSCV